MRSLMICAAVAAGALCLAAGLSIGADGPPKAARYPTNAPFVSPVDLTHLADAAEPGSDAAFGRKLFSHVTRAWFSGPSWSANSDGTLGGLVAEDEGSSITIYERYIVRETACPDQTIHRDVYAYETLGKFEQQIRP